jgi:hypothetical protein
LADLLISTGTIVELIEMCEIPTKMNPRNFSEIERVLQSHQWETKSAEKSPWGTISRFACTKCGDEFVAMLTSERNVEEETPIHLEVSAGNVVLS